VPTVIFERAIKRNPETQELESYWPERWPMDLLIAELIGSGSAFFAASYMNDPSALEGNSLKVKWLHPYTDTELDMARKTANIDRGFVWCGLDPSVGGDSTNPDYFGMVSLEVIMNKGYLLDYRFDRLSVDEQAQSVEEWLTTQMPDRVFLEEVSSRGYVYRDLVTRVNSGTGSLWPIEVRKPQAARDKGGKKIRFQAMAARFQNGQIKVPGILAKKGEIRIDPRWNPFVNQWRTFPAGHDDILDACYWAQYEAFADVQVAVATKSPDRTYSPAELQSMGVPARRARESVTVPAVDLRGKPVVPIGSRMESRRRRWWQQ
jgi:phage terminase large subunit-like protein